MVIRYIVHSLHYITNTFGLGIVKYYTLPSSFEFHSSRVSVKGVQMCRVAADTLPPESACVVHVILSLKYSLPFAVSCGSYTIVTIAITPSTATAVVSGPCSPQIGISSTVVRLAEGSLV